jgi:hypothetical protein
MSYRIFAKASPLDTFSLRGHTGQARLKEFPSIMPSIPGKTTYGAALTKSPPMLVSYNHLLPAPAAMAAIQPFFREDRHDTAQFPRCFAVSASSSHRPGQPMRHLPFNGFARHCLRLETEQALGHEG